MTVLPLVLALAVFPAVSTADVQAYRDRYDLNFPGVEFNSGYVRTPEFDLWTFCLRPAQPKGTVLFTHGFLDHAGMHARLFRVLLDEGYTVVAFDLPGHGLSSGDRGNIAEFAAYGRAAQAVLTAVHAAGFAQERPLLAVGHSTACAAFVEWLQQNGPVVDGALFVAPLVHSYAWDVSQLGLYLFGGLLPRLPDATGSDKVISVGGQDGDHDPLDQNDFPTGWVRALWAWNRQNASYGPFATRLAVVQGDHDVVVDAPYNLAWLRARFPGLVEFPVVGEDHYLLYKAKPGHDELAPEVERQLRRALAALVDCGSQRPENGHNMNKI
ncbi:MAG: alpha/beta hydrolase [Spirochaetales bacterium]